MPTIDFTTFNEECLRDWKPVLAKSLSPDWWKKMKVFQHDRGQRIQTIRACPAMDDWLKSGWYILANRDMEVVFDNGRTYTQEFGEEVAILVDGVTKITALENKVSNIAIAENF